MQKTEITFTLQDLLAPTPVTPTFDHHAINSDLPHPSHPDHRSSSCYGSNKSSPGEDEPCYNEGNGSIIHTKLTIPSNNHHTHHIKPLRLPKKPKFLARSKTKEQLRQSYQPVASSGSGSSGEDSPPLDQRFPPQNVDVSTSPVGRDAEAPPPSVKPYVLSSREANRKEKNLRGSSCCFCEEPLEFTLAGEKVVSLECGHVSHYECLFHMVELEKTPLDHPEQGFPTCPTCDTTAKPMNSTLQHEIIRDKLLLVANDVSTPAVTPGTPQSSQLFSPRTPTLGTSIGSAATPESNYKTPPRRNRLESVKEEHKTQSPPPRKQQQQHQSPSRGKKAMNCLSYASTKTGSSMASKMSDAASQQTSVPTPTVSIISEVEEITPSSESERYANFLVSVSVPKDTFSSRHEPSEEELKQREAVATRLKNSIHDWRRLNVDLFGKLRLHGSFYMSRDTHSWQEVTCYLFDTMLLCVRDYSYDLRGAKLGKSAYVKAAVNLSRDLVSAVIQSPTTLALNLSHEKVCSLYLSTQDHQLLETWHAGLIDPKLHFPWHEEGQLRSPLFPTRPAEMPVARPPVDIVLAIPGSGVPNEHKWLAVKQTIRQILDQMGQLDRLGLVVYGQQNYAVQLERRGWGQWESTIESMRPIGHISGDMLDGLTNSMKVLDSCETRNPLSVVYMVSDNSHQINDPDLYEMVVKECASTEVAIHTFGIGLNHDPDVLTRSSVTTNGTYFYVKEWRQLVDCTIGRFRADQLYTHRNVHIKLDTRDSIRVTSVNGCETTVNTDGLQGYDGSKPPQRPVRSFTPSNLQNVPLGSFCVGQTRSFLVQACIPPRGVLGGAKADTVLPLFNVCVGYGEFKNNQTYTEKHVGGASIRLNMDQHGSFLEPPPTPFGNDPRFSVAGNVFRQSTTASNGDIPPSPIYGNVVYADEPLFSAPIVLGVQKHNTHVVRRRLQLAAARTFESVIQYMSHDNFQEATNVLNESRPLMMGLVEISANGKTSGEDDLLHQETKAMAETLDRDVEVILNKIKKPILFEQDGRKWVIQTVGVLRSQLALTARSPIEQLFFQQDHMNVV